MKSNLLHHARPALSALLGAVRLRAATAGPIGGEHPSHPALTHAGDAAHASHRGEDPHRRSGAAPRTLEVVANQELPFGFGDQSARMELTETASAAPILAPAAL